VTYPIMIVLTLLLRFLLSGFAFAQNPRVTGLNCTQPSGWDWSYNSLGQSPCTVAAYMMSTCSSDGVWNMSNSPMSFGKGYTPTRGNLCMCNSLMYSLLCACSGCQGGGWFPWDIWSGACNTTTAPFPHPVPCGTTIPHWAVIDLIDPLTWNYDRVRMAGDMPELPPGTVFNRMCH
ncbi:hypothetical protein BGW80DRAFT_1358154, partial [Lactifluus volemus]